MFRLLIVIGLAVIWVESRGVAMARPQYYTAFKKAYPELAAKKINCAMCHPGSDKKKNNHYAAALAKELGEKSVKDEKRIVEALRKVEEGECKSGKWGERLKDGLAPCVDGEVVDTETLIQRWLDRPVAPRSYHHNPSRPNRDDFERARPTRVIFSPCLK